MAKPIVVAMDLSKPSLTALEEAIPIARRRGAEVVLVHATPMPGNDGSYEWVNPGIVERYREMLKDDLSKTRDLLGEIRERHAGQGAEISVTLASGDAENAISEAAEELDADLIVVGSHGREGLDRFLLGSVAERISRFTKRDVLVARGDHPRGDYKKILVPSDFSKTADRAYDVALSLAAEGGDITLLHCVEVPPAVAGFMTGQVLVDMQAATSKIGEELASAGRARGFNVTVEIAVGYPPTQIREHAGGHDLVVMGSHGRRGFRRFILGSVAEKTIRHAPCSVYIARAAEPNDEKESAK